VSALSNDKKGPREAKPPVSPGSSKSAKLRDNDVGPALKSVYDRTVREAIPPEMLDLLGKLD
jgi:hypothetical protein